MITRKQVMLMVLLAVPMCAGIQSAALASVLVYPATSCVQTYGQDGDFLGTLGAGAPRGYDLNGNGLFEGEVVDDPNSPPQGQPDIGRNTVTIYCPIELQDTTTVINQVEVFTNDDGFVPPDFLPMGAPAMPLVSCNVHVSTLDGCHGPLSGVSCGVDPDFEHVTDAPLSSIGNLELSAQSIPVRPWPTNGWSYAVLSCDLSFGSGIFSYRIDQQ